MILLRHYAKVLRQDANLIRLVIIFIILVLLAAALANRCGLPRGSLIGCEPAAENRALVNQPRE